MKKCRHPRSRRMTINHADWDCLYDCSICRECGHWLSLGPSNDRGVEWEINAARIAADMASDRRTREIILIWTSSDLGTDAERLARIIWEHDH